MKPKIIAFYLPQFHPMKENDEWWGKGFTEWTSVAKAKPLFHGHKQPKIPADLGFYDLRVPETREEQARLAKEAGIYGFCYWHYWFNGRQLMNRPFEEVVKTGKPDFPFCLAWANHSWYQKEWSNGNNMVIGKSKLLIEQTYGGEEDYTNHFYSLLPAFKDKRYIKINGRCVFMIYDPIGFQDFEKFSRIWNMLAKKENLNDFFFITHIFKNEHINMINKIFKSGYDAINVSLHRMPFKTERRSSRTILDKFIRKIKSRFKIKPEIVKYSEALKWLDNDIYNNPNVFPTIIPNWDHTPRSGRFGRVFQECNPALFKKHVQMILKRVLLKNDNNKFIFLKSWNEWGEGNYMEPDLENGKKYIRALNEALNENI